MGSNETGGESFLEGNWWREGVSKASGYRAWQLVWSVFSVFIFVAGVMLIKWGLENIETREASLALGLGLATWGLVLILVTGIAVWIKASTNSLDHGV